MGVCWQGYNARRNQVLAAARLLAPLLEQGVPAPLNASVAALLASYSAADRSAADMSHRTAELLTLFQRHGYGVTDVRSGVDWRNGWRIPGFEGARVPLSTQGHPLTAKIVTYLGKELYCIVPFELNSDQRKSTPGVSTVIHQCNSGERLTWLGNGADGTGMG